MALRLSNRIAVVTIVASFLAPASAWAHWCNTLWDSAYNIVVKPASDTVAVPASGSATLDVFVVNNMGYPLKNFVLAIKAGSETVSGFTVAIKDQSAEVVSGYLMPGEKRKYTLSITNTAGGSFAASLLKFDVQFGNGDGQDGYYRSKAGPVMIKTGSGLVPGSVPSFASGYDTQGYHLQRSTSANFGNLGTAVNDLLNYYCTGRGSWSDASTTCSVSATTAATTCGNSFAAANNYAYEHLWALGELAYRKGALSSSQLDVVRSRARCGWNDSLLTFKAFAGFVMGYLGSDSGIRDFFDNAKTGIIHISDSSADEKAIAKSAMVAMDGKSSAYYGDVKANVNSNTAQVAMVSAAALGIADKTDPDAQSAVQNKLIGQARWIEPDGSDNGQAFLAAHLLNLVAWSQRGWAPNAGDTGEVTFYGGDGGVVPYDGGGGSGGGGGGAKSSGGGGCGFAAGGAATALTAAWLLLALWRRRRA